MTSGMIQGNGITDAFVDSPKENVQSESASPSLLLVLPVPFRQMSGELHFELQACNGLARWADNFPRITVACPLIPEWLAEADQTMVWLPVSSIRHKARIECIPLPWAYHPLTFLKTYSSTRHLLRAMIRNSTWLSFAIGGLIGDWAGVASREAWRMRRPYSVWTDRVEPEVIRRSSRFQPVRRRLMNAMIVPLMKRYHRIWIQRSALGLFHGQDCHQAYVKFSQNAHCVHDVHFKEADQIDPATMQVKTHSVTHRDELRLCYVGRAIDMKGPLDWIDVFAQLRKRGIDVRATWLGDGPMLSEMRDKAASLGLNENIKFCGFTSDREFILETLRQHDIFLFCHKTPESPRCLIESLICGCPIVGYESEYARELVAAHGGGVFSAVNDVNALTTIVSELHENRQRLALLITQAGQSGRQFSDVGVFRYRSELIKRFLSPHEPLE